MRARFEDIIIFRNNINQSNVCILNFTNKIKVVYLEEEANIQF